MPAPLDPPVAPPMPTPDAVMAIVVAVVDDAGCEGCFCMLHAMLLIVLANCVARPAYIWFGIGGGEGLGFEVCAGWLDCCIVEGGNVYAIS